MLLSSELGFKLFRQSTFIFLQLKASFLLKPVFFLAYQLILLSSVLSQLALDIGLEFGLEFLHILTQKPTAVLGLKLDFLFHLGKLLFVFAFLLPLKLGQFAVKLLLHLLALSF